MTPDTTVTRGTQFVAAEVDREVVALNVDTGVCYGLNRVGSRIWALIAEPRRVADICATLTSEYDVDDATCVQQVIALLEDLSAEGLVEVLKPREP